MVVNANFEELFTSYDNIMKVLKGEEILKFDDEIIGKIMVAAYRSTTFINQVPLSSSDVLIVGDRHSVIEYAVNGCVDDFKKILMKDKTKSMQNMIFEYCLAMLKDEDKVGFLDNMIGFLLEDEIFDLDTYLDKKIELLKEILCWEKKRKI